MTIKEIARICGVSRGTVDRVVNNRGKVKPETQALILQTIAEHGYTKNIVGRALTVKKTEPVIGVILFVIGVFQRTDETPMSLDELPQKKCKNCGREYDFDYAILAALRITVSTKFPVASIS